jgi:hypothetical protein
MQNDEGGELDFEEEGKEFRKASVIENDSVENNIQIGEIEEEIENDVKDVWNKCSNEVEKLHEERDSQIESIFEAYLNKKFEARVTINSKYDSQIQPLKAQSKGNFSLCF